MTCAPHDISKHFLKIKASYSQSIPWESLFHTPKNHRAESGMRNEINWYRSYWINLSLALTHNAVHKFKVSKYPVSYFSSICFYILSPWWYIDELAKTSVGHCVINWPKYLDWLIIRLKLLILTRSSIQANFVY